MSITNLQTKKNLFRYVVAAVVIVFMSAIVPVTRDTYLLTFSILVLMNLMVASGWNIIGGLTGYSSFGHVVFFGIGAYATGIMIRDFQLSFPLAIAFGGVVAGVLAVPLGYPSLRLKGIYFALATTTLNIIGILSATLLPFTGGPEGIVLQPIFRYGPLANNLVFYGLFLCGGLAAIFLTYTIKRSKIGLSFMSIREDEDAAQACGIATSRMKLLAYVLSSIPVSMAGSLFAIYSGYIDPTTMFSFSISMYAIALTYLGGKGTILGPVIGSIIYVFFSEYFRYSISIAFEGLHVIILMILLVLIILFMPEGVIGFLRKRSSRARKFLF